MVTIEDIRYIKGLSTNNEEYREVYFELLEDLRHNIVYVEFIKKNGELREMYCTRHPGYIGVFYQGGKGRESEQSVTEKDLNNRIVRIFDMDKEAFRSFTIDSLQYIEIDSELPL